MLSFINKIKKDRERLIKNMSFKLYRKTSTIEARPYIPGEDMKNIIVSVFDIPEEDGYIARDPNNHVDQWYLRESFFFENYEEV